MGNELRELVKQERNVLKSFDAVESFIKKFVPATHGRQVEVRLQRLEEAFKEFHVVRRQIEILTDDVDDSGADSKETAQERQSRINQEAKRREEENEEVMMETEERYCSLKADLLDRLPKKTPPVGPQPVAQAPARQDEGLSRVKLPEIRLPAFSGQISEWVTFRDTFRSLIHNNKQLTAMDKFTYLRSSLSGEALQEINSIEMSDANYAVAWSTLEKRYENRKLIVKAHLDALFAVESMKRESYEALNRLISDFDKNLSMLQKVDEVTDNWSTILVHMVCSRLDNATLRNWETHHNSKDVPEYKNLMKYLRDHCSVLQSVTPSKPPVTTEKRSSKFSVSHSVVQSPNKCPFCGEAFHSPFRCGKFLKLKVAERNEVARKNQLCLNCLSAGHQARFCTKGSCHHCKQKHHSLLHPEMMQPPVSQTKSSVPPPQRKPPGAHQQQPQTQTPNQNQPTHTYTAQESTSSFPVAHSQYTDSPTTNQACTDRNTVALPTSTDVRTHEVLLSTAIVCVKDQRGNTQLARALLDSCSQYCFMTTEFSNKLKLQGSSEHLVVQGIGGSTTVARRKVRAAVLPRSPNVSSFNEEMNFYLLPELTATLPARRIGVGHWRLPSNFILADPQFNEPKQVDLIIGAEHYFELLTDGRARVGEEGPMLQNTVFGWVVSGRVSDQSAGLQQASSFSCTGVNLQDQLAKFWELETCRSNSTQSVEEAACETLFAETTVRDETGKYVVALLKRDFIVNQLGDSKAIAMRRFLGLERRFRMHPELKAPYSEFIEEYLRLGHMKQVPDDDEQFPAYYLPHHAVFKMDSTTTKRRVVFDASCKTSSGVSLNDGLMVGPVVQDDLMSIILRFRLHRVAVVADVEKMYRMVRVQEQDQRLQRILWRDSPDEPVRTYQLTTVTYGTASAPYLATKCLQRLSEDGAETHPNAAKVLKKDFYVDDMMTGADTVDKAKQLVQETLELSSSGGFNLRKWNSNSRELLAVLPGHLVDERATLELDTSSSPVKTLGLLWEPCSDNFQFRSPTWNEDSVITKRVVLADAAKLFDPLGLVGPVVVAAKIFLQELWKQQSGWDDPLPAELQTYWQEYRRNLTALSSFSVPRWVAFQSNAVAVEIHGFCDASNKAYGACLYLRCTASDGSVEVRLLTAKSRVAPLDDLKRKKKQQTIPRLELSSALLLSHLYDKVRDSIGLPHTATFWTDSTIVMHWLSSLPSRWQMFVANRVSEIQHITKGSTWNHVAGVENPADLISRGMSPVQLQYQRHWFEGPLWLSQDRSTWPLQQPNQDVDRSVLEEKSAVALPARSIPPSEVFHLRSSLFRLVRLVALLRRFAHNARHREDRRTGAVSHSEHEETTLMLVRLAQGESFPEEIAALKSGKQVKPTSPINGLCPILVDGVMRVGGRLSKAPVSETRKHPAILSHQHPLTKLILVHYHHKLFHCGQQLLISSVREKYWPTHIRRLANTVIHECVPCFRTKPKVLEQLMADLPLECVTPAPPFLRVGVDYCGPFSIVYPGRKSVPQKTFVAIFVCLVTKAVHLELVADLTSAAFLAAFRRFVGYKGTPELVMCDNALNFVGARRELEELRRLFRNQQFQQSVIVGAEEGGIEFRFIPARSPNFGGLWEAAVKSFKGHFKRKIGCQVLRHDEMHTVIVQISAILNSRPLTPISNDPMDFEALTPGHFIIQRPFTAIPEPDLEGVPENRLSMWERAQKFSQQVWKKWSSNYLSDLHNRNKWTRRRDNVFVGTLVLLKDDNLPPLKWRLGRVTEIHAGSDGNIRVVTVRSKDGLFRRAISKICILPIRDNQVAPSSEDN